jgi:hypothetical protein
MPVKILANIFILRDQMKSKEQETRDFQILTKNIRSLELGLGTFPEVESWQLQFYTFLLSFSFQIG